MRWAYDTEQDGQPANFHGDPVLTDALVLVGSDVGGHEETEEAQGYVYAFDRLDGTVRWKHGVPGGVPSDLVRRGDVLYGVTSAGGLLCLEIATGRVRFSVDPALGDAGRGLHFSLLSVGDRIVFSGPGGMITAVDADTGKKLWTRELYNEVTTTLVAGDGVAYVATELLAVFAIDFATGEIAARLELAGQAFGTPVLHEDSLLVVLDGGKFQRLGLAKGEVRWTASADQWTSFRPRVVGDHALIGNSEGELIAFALADGARGETHRVEGAVRGFAVVDRMVYVGTLPGRLFAFGSSKTSRGG